MAWAPVSPHDCQPDTAQEEGSACLSTKPIACAVERAAESAETAGTVADIRHTTASLRKVVRTIVGMCLHKMILLVFSRKLRFYLNDEPAGWRVESLRQAGNKEIQSVNGELNNTSSQKS